MVEQPSYSSSNPAGTEGEAQQFQEEQWYTDPNGIPMPRRSLYEQQYTDEQLRSMKQKYLLENVINCGYDAAEFAQFMEYRMEGGTNVDNWDFEGLMNVVTEFQQHYQPVGTDQLEGQEQTKSKDQPNVDSDAAGKNQGDPQESSSAKDSDFEDITDEAIQYRNDSKKEDQTLPKLQTRARANTARIVPTDINYHKVVLKVTDSEVRKGGFFSSDYVIYTITTEPLGWKVGRKDTDFYTLRRILKAQFPHILVPPLPVKSNKMTQKFLTKREKQFQRFLQAISRSEELKSSICLNNFLEIQDLKEFQKANKVFEKTKYGKSIVELVTEKGNVGVNMNQNAMVFCTRMTDFTDSYQILYQEIIETTREIKEKSADLAKTMHTLGEHLEKLGNINYMIRVDRLHELYAWLSKMSTGTGNHIANLGDLFKVYLGSHLKYHMSEHESFRELYGLRETVKQNFMKKERHLIERKEKLYKSQDISRWGFEGNQDDLIRRKDELLNDKDKAYRFMLSKESQELEHFREELFFYSNQCLAEVRRVGSDNGLLLTDHFITMSQIQCAYVNQHHVMWADFLSHFSEIGMVEGAQSYEVIKQRPSEHESAGSKPSQADKEEEKKEETTASVAVSAAAISSTAIQNQADAFMNSQAEVAAAQSSSDNPGHSRRISRLDDVGKFQASLEAVRVENRSSRSNSMVEPEVPVADVVQEEAEGEEEEELKQDHAEESQPNRGQNNDAVVVADNNDDGSDSPVLVNDDAQQVPDSGRPAESGRESQQNQQITSREESSGGEQRAAVSDSQEAN